MKKLVLVGAGGCGREVLQWAVDINRRESRWEIKGFLDDDPDALKGRRCEWAVLDSVADYRIEEDDEFVCCIGNSDIRKRVMEDLTARGAHFVQLIHPTAVIADNALIGEGCVIYPYALISDNAEIGDGCIINMYSSVAHDSVLGAYCTISAHCDITGMCTLGDAVFMGSTSQMVPGTKIGSHVYIGAGSTVMTRVRDGRKMLGNPAKPISF